MAINYRTFRFARLFLASGLMGILSFPGESLPADDEKVWAALEKGGMVVLMRHTHVDLAAGNPLTLAPGNCAAELNLTRRGREQAKRIGKAFRARRILIGDVLASPYCRSLETGMLAFGKATSASFLIAPPGVSDEQAALNSEQALQLIVRHKGPRNLVMITQEPNIAHIILETAEQGEVFVLKPEGGTDFDVVGRISFAVE